MYTPPKDTVQFYIGTVDPSGAMTEMQDYSSHLKSYNLHYDLFEGAGSFTADIDIQIPLRLAQYPLKFRWVINGKAMMIGYVDAKSFSYSKTNMSQTIRGRDMMQVLIDNYVQYPKPYTNYLLKDIIADVYNSSTTIKRLASYVNGAQVLNPIVPNLSIPYVNFIYTTEAKALLAKLKNFKHIKSKHGHSLFDFISLLCNQIGLYLFNIPGTSDILIHGVTSPSEALRSYDKEGLVSTDDPYQIYNTPGLSNVINCSFTEDITGFHKYHKLVGQCQLDNTVEDKLNAIYSQSQIEISIQAVESYDPKNPGTGWQGKGYQGTTKCKVTDISEVDLGAWVETRELLLNNLLIQQARKLFNVRYTVSDHSPANTTEPYFVNHIAYITDESINLNKVQMLTYAIEYAGSKDQGRTTTLTLCIPGTVVGGIDV